MKKKYFFKIIAIACLLLLTAGVIIAWNSPAKSYEASIYLATPPIVWIALIINIIVGLILAMYEIKIGNHKNHRQWLLGFSLLFLSFITMLSLWITRGYVLWCPGDPLTHLGRIKETISSGFVESGIFYPTAYIHAAQFSQILDVDPTIPHKYLPLIFGIFSVAFSYLLAKAVLPDKGQVILATVISMAFLQGWYLNFTPNHLSNLLFPLVLFLLFKSISSAEWHWKLLLIIMIFLIPVFHPIPGFILLLILLTVGLFNKVIGLFNNEKSIANNRFVGFNATTSLLLIVWLITWVSSFYVWNSTIRNVQTLINEGGPTKIYELFDQVLYGVSQGYSAVEQFFKLYGGISILILFALITLPIVLKKMNKDPNIKDLSSLYGPLGFLALLIVILYFLNLSFGPLRMLVYVVLICTLFAGFLLYELLNKGQNCKQYLSRILLLPFAIVVMLFFFLNGGLQLYPSRYTLEVNWQITISEINGWDWFLSDKNTNMNITTLLGTPGRFADLLLSAEERTGRQDLRNLDSLNVPEEPKLPFHFGYDNDSLLGQYYAENLYLVLSNKDRLLYQDIFPEIAHIRFLSEDFEKLEQDTSVAKLYSNDGFDAYYINGAKQG